MYLFEDSIRRPGWNATWEDGIGGKPDRKIKYNNFPMRQEEENMHLVAFDPLQFFSLTDSNSDYL